MKRSGHTALAVGAFMLFVVVRLNSEWLLTSASNRPADATSTLTAASTTAATRAAAAPRDGDGTARDGAGVLHRHRRGGDIPLSLIHI